MKKLELIVCSDVCMQIAAKGVLENYTSQVMEELGIDYVLEILKEETLLDEKNFSKNAILFVHGSAIAEYKNVSHVRELAQKRPDLRFILQIDKYYALEDFRSNDDYEFVKRVNEAGFNAVNQVVVSNSGLDFFSGYNRAKKMQVEHCLKNYVQQLMELRK